MPSPKDSSERSTTRNPITPIGISKLNCEAALGITERQLYDLGRKYSLPRLPGKIPVYRADALLALFESGIAINDGPEEEDDQPLTPDAVLAALGRRRTG